MPRTFHNLQALRGVACLAVVLYHVGGWETMIWPRVNARGAPTTSSQAGSWSTAMSGTMRSGVKYVRPLADFRFVPGRTK